MINKINGDKMKKNKIQSKPVSKRGSLQKSTATRKKSRRYCLAVSKKALLQKSTATAIEMCNKLITNKQLREQNIAFIKAANGKKIRNTSGI